MPNYIADLDSGDQWSSLNISYTFSQSFYSLHTDLQNAVSTALDTVGKLYYAITALGLLALPLDAYAWSCSKQTLEENFRTHELVFSAKIIKTRQEKNSCDSKNYLQTLAFEKNRIWKGGLITNEAKLVAHPASYVSEAALEENKTYVFFTNHVFPIEIDVSCEMPQILTGNIRKKLNQLSIQGEAK